MNTSVKLSGLRYGQRMAIAFGLMLTLAAVLAGVGSWRLLQSAEVTRKVAEQDVTLASKLSEWRGLTEANAVRTMSIAINPDTDGARAYFQPEIDATSKAIDTLQKDITALIGDDPQLVAQLEQMGKKRDDYRAARKKMFESGGLSDATSILNTQLKPALEAYLASMRELVQAQSKRALASGEAAADDARRDALVLALVALAGVVLGSIFAVVATRAMATPLRAAAEVAHAVANGDLNRRVPAEMLARGDEVGDLLRALTTMAERLGGLVGEVRSAASQITTASGEIATGNADLSSRTEEQAGALQQTSSSMQQLSTTVKSNAESARQANQLAMSASEVATRGGAVVEQVVSTMGEITESSRRIADIIGVIDGIAFQTNILALNAAVEAARAGEQGRGFAVVAGEVRSLAQQSAEAAREIKALIEASVQRVESGSRLVIDAGQTMGEIVSSVRRVTDIIGEISAATGEQNGEVQAVSSAMEQLDRGTQQNAALVEESAAASASLREQAGKLLQVIESFVQASRGHGAADEPVRVAAPVRAAVKTPARAAKPAARAIAARPATPAARPAPAPVAKAQPAKAAAPAKAPAPVAKAPAPAARPAPAPAGGDDDWQEF